MAQETTPLKVVPMRRRKRGRFTFTAPEFLTYELRDVIDDKLFGNTASETIVFMLQSYFHEHSPQISVMKKRFEEFRASGKMPPLKKKTP